MNKTLVIIPALNEEKNIRPVIKKVIKCLPRADILVVDDGSTDQTAKIAEEEGVIIISHPFNLGYGVALQTGYKFALLKDYYFVCQLDADGQHEPSCLPDLLMVIEKKQADVALGSRFLRSDHSYKTSYLKYLGMLIFGRIASLITKQKITDPTSGFQAFNKDVVRFFTSGAFPTDFPDADVLIMLYFAGYKIKEVPVIMYPKISGRSMHQGLKPFYYIFKMFLSIFLTLFREKKIVKEPK